MHAFESLLNSALPSETHRSLALYITYAVHKPKDKTSRLRATKTVRRPNNISEKSVHRSMPNAPLRESPDYSSHRALSRMEVGVIMLELYTKILCKKDTNNIKRFARTVTNKVSDQRVNVCSLTTVVAPEPTC